MEKIEIIKKAIKRKHPCDPCHEALNTLEIDITELIMCWNDLPDKLRISPELDHLATVIRDIGGL